MSNVLTSKAKKKLGSRVRARFIFVGAVVLLLGALVASLALAPTLISLQIARASLNTPSEEENEARDDATKAVRAQSLITALTPLVATSSPIEILSEALATRPSGISVTSISYQEKKLQFSGTSARREGVSAFRDALEKSGLFASVTVPVAALVGTQDGRFTITLQMK